MISKGHIEQLLDELAGCKTDKDRFKCAKAHLDLAYADGTEDCAESIAEQQYHGNGDLPDLSEDLGWLRTRIERGEKIDALKIVDEIEAAL